MPEAEVKTYTIGGTRYVQRSIVLGQLRLLMPVLAGIEIQTGSSAELISVIGGRLPEALAVVLAEEGEALREAMHPERLEERAGALAWSMTPDAALEVAEDFFVFNRVSSVGERIAAAVEALRRNMREETGSSTRSSSFPEATSPEETGSCGPRPPEPPSSGSESGSANEQTRSGGSS
jgi:hypothetical protein